MVLGLNPSSQKEHVNESGGAGVSQVWTALFREKNAEEGRETPIEKKCDFFHGRVHPC